MLELGSRAGVSSTTQKNLLGVADPSSKQRLGEHNLGETVLGDTVNGSSASGLLLKLIFLLFYVTFFLRFSILV